MICEVQSMVCGLWIVVGVVMIWLDSVGTYGNVRWCLGCRERSVVWIVCVVWGRIWE